MDNVESKLTGLQAELKTYFNRAAEEKKAHGAALESTKAAITALQRQVDALDMAGVQRHFTTPVKSLTESLEESDSIARLVRNKKGSAVITLSGRSALDLYERKTTISSSAVGAQTSGVLQIDRIPGITPEARQVLRVRDLLSARPTTMQIVDFVKVNAPMAIASPVVEAALKPENAVTFQSVSEKVRLIATWIPATSQILQDFEELSGFINSTLPFYVNLAEELQMLTGDGTGENLHGLIPQASAFQTSLLSNVKGWNKIDIVGRAIQQITAAKELDPTFVILHPNDWFDMRLQKDSYGRYILGDPQANVKPSLFGLDVVYTTSIANGTFLVGSGNPVAAEIRDRMETTVEISTEHASFFTQNLVAIRAEKRVALLVKRTASFISGTFTTSP